MFLLDVLDNLPRLRLSSSQLKMILWIMREVGAKNVPSFKGFRQMQNQLRTLCGVTTSPQKSSLGNHFYVNDPRDIIHMDFANPQVAPYINIWPEVTDGPISETWQAERWKEVPLDLLTPAARSASGSKQFYVNELNELQNGQLVIPIIWMRRHGELYGDCRLVQRMNNNKLHVEEASELVSIQLSQFCYNYYDLLEKASIVFEEPFKQYASNMPNPLRKLADDEDLVTIFIPLWADDVSGARSKQYQKHVNVYMVNSNLPGRLLQQEYFVKFVSTSPHASAPEQFEAIMPLIQETHKKPIRCFNAATNRHTRVRLIVPDLPADNPQQAEEASHIGMNANCKCRRCKPGELRNATQTKEAILEQLRLAAFGVAQKVADHQTASGVKDKIAQHWIEQLIQKAREIKASEPGRSSESIADQLAEWLKTETAQPFNILLTISTLDPTQDTPVELLHTILLGLVKYYWHSLHTSWTEANQDLFTLRLQATDIQGLNIPPIRASYIIQYRNGLIGKHFKTIMQTATFHVHDIASPSQFKVMKAMEINNMAQYLDDLKILIDNALDAFDDLDPARILVKGKLHVLKHILADIRRFGPAVRFSTEIFECFNAIFRMCSVLSNHQAPSRDIAHKLADIDRVKHILSGEYWLQDHLHVQAGKDVRSLLKQQTIIQHHLGWTPDKPFIAGSVKIYPQQKRKTCHISETLAFMADNYAELGLTPDSIWSDAIHVVAQSGDVCKVGAWVVVISEENQANIIGRIAEILTVNAVSDALASSIVILDTFLVGNSLHSTLGMPILRRPSPTHKTYHVVPSKAIQFILNVQHDCCTCACQITASRPILQERELTGRVACTIFHNDDNHFVINTHALHNSHLLRRCLPRTLTAPQALVDDRVKWHAELATVLRVDRDKKRSETRAKAAATRARNKAVKTTKEEAKRRVA
ncbi:hypothetical protein BKA93DRAFT_819090 [Sparassis latifolia]